MADKEMTERSVLAEKIPNAVLIIRLFHALRSFRREITSEKWVSMVPKELQCLR